MMVYLMMIITALLPATSNAFLNNPLKRVEKDLLALTRRVTAHHILLPPNSDDAAVALKRKIRDQCAEQNRFIVDVFQDAAKRYSKDDTTNFRGGLLGELVPQGYCRSQVLDRACFEVPLGQMEGPFESEYGCHLILVSERMNCPKLDGGETKLVQTSDGDVFGTLVPSQQVGQVGAGFFIGQVGYWLFVFLAGGILAELITNLM